MKTWYGTEESFETLKMVAAENMLTVFVDGYYLVIPDTCYYECESFQDLLQKEEELKKCRVTVEWMS